MPPPLLLQSPIISPTSTPPAGDGSKPADYGASSGRSTSAEEMASAEAADGEFYVGDAANITLLECWRRPDYWCARCDFVPWLLRLRRTDPA